LGYKPNLLIIMNRKELESEYGRVWDTSELKEDFNVLGFLAPHIACVRKSDELTGSMQFQHQPRFYFSFVGEDGLTDEDRELKRKMEAGEKVTIGEVLGIKSDKDAKEWAEKFAARLGL